MLYFYLNFESGGHSCTYEIKNIYTHPQYIHTHTHTNKRYTCTAAKGTDVGVAGKHIAVSVRRLSSAQTQENGSERVYIWMSEWKADDAYVFVWDCIRVCLCVCVWESVAYTCELVSSQGHLVIPQAYQGQRTHKYQRQMPHSSSNSNNTSNDNSNYNKCNPVSVTRLPIQSVCPTVCLSFCVCMYGIFNFIIEADATILSLRIAAHLCPRNASPSDLVLVSLSLRRIAQHLWQRHHLIFLLQRGNGMHT